MDLIRRIVSGPREVARLLDENAKLRRQLEREHHAAYHDPLTGLPNRRNFYERAGALLVEAQPVVALMLDLDRFKPINDRIGHAAGDAVLVAVAGRLDRQLGDRWLVARLGGDEFAAVLTGTADEPALVAEAAALAELVAAPMWVDRYELRVGCSIGLAVAGGRIELPELLGRADAALATSKGLAGRPVVWHPRRDDDTARRTGVRPAVRTRDLRRARFGRVSVLVAADAGGMAAAVGRARPASLAGAA